MTPKQSHSPNIITQEVQSDTLLEQVAHKEVFQTSQLFMLFIGGISLVLLSVSREVNKSRQTRKAANDKK